MEVMEVSTSKSRFSEIDILRFIAVVMVILFHYTFRGYAADDMSIMPYPLLAPIFKYGRLGVNLFFIISGFVIMMTISKGDFWDFLASRVSRLYPAFWFCCTLTFFAMITFGGTRYSATFTQYILNMILLGHIFYVIPIDGVYWSLSAEINFYTLISIIILLKRIDKIQYVLLFWIIISIPLELYKISGLRDILITRYSAYFIAGASFFFLQKNGPSILTYITILLSWIQNIQISYDMFLDFEKTYNDHISFHIILIIMSSFFVIFLLISLNITSPIRKYRFNIIGAITYPAYLIHQNIGFIIFNIAYPHVNKHIILWSTFSLMLLISYLIHKYIEKPISKHIKHYILSKTNHLSRNSFSKDK